MVMLTWVIVDYCYILFSDSEFIKHACVISIFFLCETMHSGHGFQGFMGQTETFVWTSRDTVKNLAKNFFFNFSN